jgi:2-polyprenyl-3-methyl-5-hydroxy-6-metoxy-1,4-benzoquinol methylase
VDTNQYRVKPFRWSSHTVIAQMLGDTNADSILDVGSDEGFLGQSLTYKPRELWAIDKSNRSLPKIYSSFWQKDVDQLAFFFLGNKTFQAIVLADVVEHLRNPEQVVSNLKKHLDKGGFFIFSFPNMGFLPVRILDFLGIRPKMARGLYDRTHLHDFDLKTADLFLKNTGLEVLEFRVTAVPLPLFSNLFNEGSLLFFLYKIMNFLAQKFSALFAYQLIFKTKINET